MSTSIRARSWREFNPLMVVAVLLLLAISLPMVYTTTVGSAGTLVFGLGSSFAKHIVWISVGVSLMFGLALLDYQLLRSLAIVLYVAALGLLGMVVALGQVKYGAQSWIGSSQLSFQPTEPAKLMVIIALAAFWSKHGDEPSPWKSVFVSLVILAVPLGLVMLQPDFGSGMVMIGIWLVMSLVANTRWVQYGLLSLLGAPVVVLAWLKFDQYQRERLTVFLTPERCETDIEFRMRACWQIIQSRLAIGNGGLGGMGLLRGVQSQLNYLPVQESDFIFAVTAEELGFIGAAVVIVLQLIIIWQIWRVVERARDPFGRLMVAGIGGLLLVHCLENIGMNLIMMPMTGIPLPFLSYGGSFTLTVLMGIGIVLSVSIRSRRWSFN
ncbi:FtsW/RodA/SpoVE family cell cycle protein [Herpetosiphon llansteffanensis]|uniref:FtsW/RodA/SpoVE family cell cycle protein n=1 Tax=Herpetosiphon llansteffanensis TaxID=2094568 RepID=UPI000D7BB14C|nr:FtsW/RodA/SpoVE family cell cycle protein [Herpetosiphon llansteffanensis]